MGKKYRSVSIDTDRLIKSKNGQIDWKGSVGVTMKYCIDGTNYNGTVRLLDAISPNKVRVQIDNEDPFVITRDSFLKTTLCSHMGIRGRIFQYEVGANISAGRYSVIVLERKLITNNIGYRVRCVHDGYEYDITESALTEALKLGHVRCPICSNRIIVDGINSLYDASPELAAWFIDKEIPHRISRYSNAVYKLKCPVCGYELFISPQNIRTVPTCPHCSDNISYPEKMFSNILRQLEVEYIHQLSSKYFKWCGKYRFDFYFKLNGVRYIFELDGGLGHGKIELKPNKSLERDILKDRLAKDHGINLFRIDVDYDCVKTRFAYIKESIYNSAMSIIFDLDSIDWKRVELDSEKSYLKLCCDMYNAGNTYIRSIANMNSLSCDTVRRYLVTGAQIGICSYNPSNGWSDYMNNHFSGSSSKKYIKVSNGEKSIVCEGIYDARDHIHEAFDVYISTRQIFKHLKQPLSVTRKGLYISYATKEDYLIFVSAQLAQS